MSDLFDNDFLARLERLHLIAKRLAARQTAGTRRSQRLGDGLEFADHRAYSEGDDIRFIDWPYYARMEKLLLRMFHQHSEADVAILLDCSSSMAPGAAPDDRAGGADKFNYARRAAAALAYVAMGSLERVILQPFSDQCGQAMHTGRNRGQIFEVLDFLSGLAASGRTQLKSCLERFAREHPAAGTALIVSDLLDCADELADALAMLRPSGCDVAVLHLYSPDDAAPALEGPMRLRAAEGHEQVDLLVTRDILESYRRSWKRFEQGCQRTCLGRGAIYVAAPTDLPFETLVLQSLRKAGVLNE